MSKMAYFLYFLLMTAKHVIASERSYLVILEYVFGYWVLKISTHENSGFSQL